MDLDKVFRTFVSNLREREGFLSEDNIRFYWFASMLKQDPNLNHYSLEEPYRETDKKKGLELDLMYENDVERLCIEIKFHRNHLQNETQKPQTFAVTQAAGEIFDDICRLPHWIGTSGDNKQSHYFFLYVTDDEMHKYLSNTTRQKNNSNYRTELKKFYTIKEDDTFVFAWDSEKLPKVFKEQAMASFGSTISKDSLQVPKVKMKYTKDIFCPSLKKVQDEEENCHIRFYEVIRNSSGKLDSEI